MAYNAILDAEIQVDDALTQSLMQKIKDNDEYLNSTIGSLAGSNVNNGSFEVAGDTATDASGWTLTAYAGGTVERNTAANAHGTACIKMVHPGGAGNGGGVATSEYFACFEGTYDLSFLTWSTATSLYNFAKVEYYDADKLLLSSETPWSASGGQPSTQIPVTVGFTVPANGRFLKVLLVGGWTSVDAAGTAYFDDVGVAPNTANALAVAANSDNVAIVQNAANSTSWTQIGSDTIVLDVIDGGSGSTEITFTAETATENVGWAAYLRFRVGIVYSNEITTNSVTLVSGLMTLTIPNLTDSSISVIMEAKNDAVLLAHGKVGGYDDTTVEIV